MSHPETEEHAAHARSSASTPQKLRSACCALLLSSAAYLLIAGSAFAVEPGDPAKNFEAPTLDGASTISLESYRGKVVYLDFWASWCAPCQTAIPLIDELRSEFPPEHFQVVAVNLDKSTKKAMKFLKKNPIGYPSASDPKGKLPRQFGLKTMPTSYLIDQKGVVRYVHKGFREGDIEEIRAQISKLVGPRVAARR